MQFALNVNGKTETVDVEPETPLLWVLRDTIGLTGTKYGCGIARCGACTIHVDGQPMKACQLQASAAVGKKITTIEGLAPSEDKLHPVQAAFIAHDALMCGFCTPGFILSIRNYLDKNPHATLAQIQNACAGNTCRCGTYPRVFAAARDAAKKMHGAGKEA